METGNGSIYSEITRKYLNGRVPFRIWMLSSLAGALLVVINNLVTHNAPLEGFFSMFFINAGITIPIFFAQAHFVGLALQKNPKKARKVLAVTLAISWLIIGSMIAWIMSLIYESGWNSGAALLSGNFSLLCSSWWILSHWMFRVRK